jgi:hypothetical protein
MNGEGFIATNKSIRIDGNCMTKTKKVKLPKIHSISDCTVEFYALPKDYGRAEDFMNHLRDKFNLPEFEWSNNNDTNILVANFPPDTIEYDGEVEDYLDKVMNQGLMQ